jgi:aspartate ammonia-lyase
MAETRIEKDLLGEMAIPVGALWGIHTARALENFPVTGQKVPVRLIHAFGEVKLACALVNKKLGYLDESTSRALEAACSEMAAGQLDEHILVDAFQGGAGTSTNLNVCEVLANRTLQLLGKDPGEYGFCDPIEQVNLHQSTNDTYPTALRVALLRGLKDLETAVTAMQEAAQEKEREFAHVLKVGRTELMDAVPMTLGRTCGAWAEALSRDRWRIFKAGERLRVINLGGTAIGTGLGAPREFIFQAADELRRITGLPLARAENLVEATQNLDVLVEAMGMLKAHAVNLAKLSGDLRLLAMGPDAGPAEIHLPALQAGSSLMPGKVNPVIPEMLAQVAMQVVACDQAVTAAASAGQLELNAFLPLIAYNMLSALDWLAAAGRLTAERCLRGLAADETRCREAALRSAALATVLVPVIGYHQAQAVAEAMRSRRRTLQEAAEEVAGIKPEALSQLLSPEAVNALGFVKKA